MIRYTTYQDKKALINGTIHEGDTVLDVGFWGQGTSVDDPAWPHRFLIARAKQVYGVDMEYDDAKLPQESKFYKKGNAENTVFDTKFDVVFAGDLIEHLSNPGQFLTACAKQLSANGRLVLTTPNCFNLFNLTEKLSKYEPTVNSDHTMYFNYKTLGKLLEKNGFTVSDTAYVYALDTYHQESIKKKFLNIVYRFLSLFTDKFMETLVVIAVRKKE